MSKKSQFPHPHFTSKTSYPWYIVAVVCIGATMSALDVSIVNIAMPTIKSYYNISMAQVEWTAIAYMMGLTVALPVFGRLSDMYGRVRLYNWGFVFFTIFSVMCGAAPSVNFLIVSRALQSMGAGLLQGNSIAIIAAAVPVYDRGKAIGIQGGVQAVAMALGPTVGGVLITYFGWRSIFYVNLPIGIIGTIAALLILPRDQQLKKESIDYMGTALFTAGLICLVLGFNKLDKLGLNSPAIHLYFAAAIAALILFVITELKVKHPLVDLRLFKNFIFWSGTFKGMLNFYAFFGLLFLAPFYMERVLGYSVEATGGLLSAIPIAMAVAAPFAGGVTDKRGFRLMTTLGMLIGAVASFMLVLMGRAVHPFLIVAVFILFGLSRGFFTPANNTAVMGATPKDKLSVAGGLLNMARSLGLIFGVDISGLLFASLEHGYVSKMGFQNVAHIFKNQSIPAAIKTDAFMKGFIVVMLTFVLLDLTSSFISSLRNAKPDLEAIQAAKELEGA